MHSSARSHLLLVVFLSPLLASCGFLNQRIELSLSESKKIADRCEAVQEPFQAKGESLIRRLRTAVTFQVETAEASCTPVMTQSLRTLADLLSRNRVVDASFATALSERLRDRQQQISAAITEIHLRVDKIELESKVNLREICASRSDCATRMAVLLDGAVSDVRVIVSKLQEIKSAVEAAAADLSVATEALRAARNELAFAAGQAERELRSIQRLVDVAVGVVTDGDFELIIKTYINERTLAAFDKAARRAINSMVKTMRPLERSIETADNKAYGLVSVVREIFGSDFQAQVDKAAKTARDGFYKAVHGESQSALTKELLLKAHLSLARASCEKLLGPASEDDDSYITPFLLRAMVHSFSDDEMNAVGKLINPEVEKSDQIVAVNCTDQDSKDKKSRSVDPVMMRFVTTYVGVDYRGEAHGRGTSAKDTALKAVSQTVRSVRADREKVAPTQADTPAVLTEEERLGLMKQLSRTTIQLNQSRINALGIK